MSFGIFPGGYYDEQGEWQRSKFCFVDCGDRCICRPPGGLWYDAGRDKRITDQASSSTNSAARSSSS